MNDEGQLYVKISLIRQANNFIHNVEPPYTMESVLRVKNCMYARYTGPEEKLFLSFSPSVEKQQHFLKVLSRMADQVKFQLK